MPTKSKAKGPQIAKISGVQISWGFDAEGKLAWSHTPPPLEIVKSGQIAWRAIWCSGFDVDEQGKKHYHHLECIPCTCPPGPQMRMQFTKAREIALLGGRGSAKSEGTFAFLTNGNVRFNLDTKQWGYPPNSPRPADITYLNCADYSFLVLRKNSKDLISYFKRASRYFEAWGGTMTQEPMGVKFPSGAFGIFDHLADADAYEKYVGQEFTRIVVEEANQIPEEKRYLKITASCRTSNLQMRPQIMLTYNPGGPGSRWLKSRFINPGGAKLPFDTLYKDPYSGQARIAIFSTVEDNPYTMASGYDKVLDALRSEDGSLYKQWRHGDFDVEQGAFFDMFRPKRLEGELENACHVVNPHALPAEWPTAICCDWGYSHSSAVYWLKWSPKRQLHVCREFVVSRMGARDLGVEIARRSLDYLAESPYPKFNLYLSHDAFHRENEGATEAELIAQGIDTILGTGAAFVFDRSEEERLLDEKVSWDVVKQRAERRRKSTYITVINAGMKRRGNLNLIRDYLRWWPLESESMQFDEAIHRNLLEAEGQYAADEYKGKCGAKPPENLPVLRIHYDEDAPSRELRGCEKLVVAMQSMIEKENNTEEAEKIDGDDPVDALAYGVGNFPFMSGYISDEAALKAKVRAIRDKNPGAPIGELIPAIERAEYEHKRSRNTGGFNIPRLGAAFRHRTAPRFAHTR